MFAPLPPALSLQAPAVPILSAPTAVDVRVKSVEWNPRGSALLYARDEAAGLGLGLFSVGDAEGKVVLHLPPGDRWRCEWFEGADVALVTVERETKETKSLRIYVLNAAKKTATEVFARTAPAADGLSVRADLSPSLSHAILTVREGEKAVHHVLPPHGGRVVASPDIDRAVANGLAGPGWTRRGTATYGEQVFSAVQVLVNGRLSNVIQLYSRSLDGGQTTHTAQVRIIDRVELGGSEALGGNVFSLRVAPPPAPESGKATLEVVPSNGVLRPVRSPGPWASADPPPPGAATEGRDLKVEADGLRVQSRGLLLVGGEKALAWRVVVAPRADWGALAPRANAVAYATDGALFVRGVRRG